MKLIQLTPTKKFLAVLVFSLLAAILLVPGAALAQEPVAISPALEGLPSDSTDYEKLQAFDYLIHQLLLEHNKIALLARGDWDKYGDRFRTYAQASKAKLKLLLNERNTLREKIRLDSYTEKEWSLIKDTELLDQIYFDLYGDKSTHYEIKLPSTVISPPLEELKEIDFYKLDPTLPPPDPIEDLSTYTEVDPVSYTHLTLPTILLV